MFSKRRRLLKIYEDEIGINWTWQSLDSISIKSTLLDEMTGSNFADIEAN